jgi:hypothetical protein
MLVHIMNVSKKEKLQDIINQKSEMAIDPHYGTKFLCETEGDLNMVVHVYTDHNQAMFVSMYINNEILTPSDTYLFHKGFDADIATEVAGILAGLNTNKVTLFSDVSEYDVAVAFVNAFNLRLNIKPEIKDKSNPFDTKSYHGAIHEGLFNFEFKIPDELFNGMSFGSGAENGYNANISYFVEKSISERIRDKNVDSIVSDEFLDFSLMRVSSFIQVGREQLDEAKLDVAVKSLLKEIHNQYNQKVAPKRKISL